jgi:hypothetical protein
VDCLAPLNCDAGAVALPPLKEGTKEGTIHFLFQSEEKKLNGVNDYFTRISGKHFNVYLPKRGKQDGEIAPILQQGASDNIHPLASAMGPL